MSTVSYRGVVHDGKVVLRGVDSPLADGTEVLITPLTETRGSGAALVAALDRLPKMPAEWVDELEMIIDQGRRISGPNNEEHTDRTDIVMSAGEWQAFHEAHDSPPRDIPTLRMLLTEVDVFAKEKPDGEKGGE